MRGRRSIGWVLLVSFAVLGNAAALRAAEPQGGGAALLLGAVPVEAAPDVRLGAAMTLVLHLYPSPPTTVDELARELGRVLPLTGARAGAVDALLDGRPRAVVGATPPQQPTFVLDYDQPAFGPLLEELHAADGPHPTVEQLRGFVHDYITKKDLARAYDIASVIASQREGDCTEHAVLLAALLRAHGYVARVMNGLVIFDVGGRPQAFCHTWAETTAGGSWRVVDATRVTENGTAVFVPLRALSDEGPAYGADVLRTPYIERITLSVAPAAE
jgi:transglutaminase-like putative cysteine protease